MAGHVQYPLFLLWNCHAAANTAAKVLKSHENWPLSLKTLILFINQRWRRLQRGKNTKLSAGFWPRQTSRYPRIPSHPLKAFCTIQMPPKVTQGVWLCWAFLMPRRSFLSDFIIWRFFRRRRRRFKGQQFSHLPQIPRNLSQLLLPA